MEALSAITVTNVRRKDRTAGKSAALRPGQFCRARFAVFAARREPVWSDKGTNADRSANDG